MDSLEERTLEEDLTAIKKNVATATLGGALTGSLLSFGVALYISDNHIQGLSNVALAGVTLANMVLPKLSDTYTRIKKYAP